MKKMKFLCEMEIKTDKHGDVLSSIIYTDLYFQVIRQTVKAWAKIISMSYAAKEVTKPRAIKLHNTYQEPLFSQW